MERLEEIFRPLVDQVIRNRDDIREAERRIGENEKSIERNKQSIESADAELADHELRIVALELRPPVITRAEFDDVENAGIANSETIRKQSEQIRKFQEELDEQLRAIVQNRNSIGNLGANVSARVLELREAIAAVKSSLESTVKSVESNTNRILRNESSIEETFRETKRIQQEISYLSLIHI